ncbi:SDR family NAD(P)-dependent oxidoreductase [Propionimicrobium sp. PCR01-08-3]|uniref:SDR family NAD(P)-dependent oxidoreductase n=1 Tax=Propionimicrobium sp. PCR01-08-3 TaxID=3052086 RepID=UPI00255C7006|nr:SDR family NAD(P)-dependent oxidoreductase [Propionimicrobium sp. PCR01-08-3]WIY84026.1 SDR family NAD(P)-dependent oxidoreductase [Propionimicrobium sp. PCR01-08-3]
MTHQNGTLAGKRALVTGGGVGIGAETARVLAREGARVALTYRTHKPDDGFLRELEDLSGNPVLALAVDATEEPDVVHAVAQVSESFGGIDILVNNIGGMVQRSRLEDMTVELWRTVLDVNVLSTMLFTREAHAHMGRGARIINVASLAGENGGHPGALAYASSKGAVITFTRALARELAPEGITVNAVAPGFIEDTPFHDTFTSADSKAETVTTIPMGRVGEPAEVGEAIGWLATDRASFVSGEVLDINGAQYFA